MINDNNNNGQIVMRVYQKGQLVLDEKVQDQISINTDAKETIKDLFPNIPDNDLFQIIKTAFQLGDGKVGTADEIPLVRRALLSVVAHIRHTYTNYDRLLRRLPYNQARHEVEEVTLRKLVEWRGDDDTKGDDSHQRAVDDLVRDVIVVSDDDDESTGSDADNAEQIRPEELRVEELLSDSYGPLQPRPFSPSRELYEEAPAGYRIVPQVARRERLTNAEVEAHRRAVWEQARQAYRSRVPEPEPQYQRVYLDRSSPERTLIPLDPPNGSVIRREYLGPAPAARPVEYEVGILSEGSSTKLPTNTSALPHSQDCTNARQMHPPSRPLSPRYSTVAADGRRYERVPLDAEPAPVYYRRKTPPINSSYSHSRPLTPLASHFPPQRRRSASPDMGHGSVLPSIEGPNGPLSPAKTRRSAIDQTRTWPTPPSNFATRGKEIIDLTGSQESLPTYRPIEGQVDGASQARDNRQVFLQNSVPAYTNQSSRPYGERRMVDVDRQMSGAGERVFREPPYGERDVRYRELYEADPPAPRRILMSQDDLRLSDAPRSGYGHSNAFDAPSSSTQARALEPPPAMSREYGWVESRARPLSPPRRILEPLPPERYLTQPYARADQLPTMERRIVYTAPPPHQASDRR